MTASQLRRLERRSAERRRVSPQVLLLRHRAVLAALLARDRWAAVGALEDLAAAAMAWSAWIRKHGL